MPKKTSKKAAARSKAAASKVTAARGGKKKLTARGSVSAKSVSAKSVSAKSVSAKSVSAKSAAPKNGSGKQAPPARRSKKVQPIPDMYGPVTAQLVVSPCDEALEFYARAFGAKEVMRMPGADGLLMHAEMNVGGSIIMLADEVNMPGSAVRKSPKNAGAITGGVMLYVKDVDAAFERAIAAGATAAMPPQDQFWGDRFGQVEDPFGHVWSMATHTRDVSPEEMQQAMSQMPSGEA